MFCIGLRVSPNKNSPKIFYSVVNVEGNKFDIVRSSFLNIPVVLNIPEQLAFIRTNLLAIMLEYNIENAGLRVSETIAPTPSVYRYNIEGVIQELFANSTIKKYEVMRISQMSKLLEDKDIKEYLENKKVFAEIKKWDSLKLEERESIICSVAASNL